MIECWPFLTDEEKEYIKEFGCFDCTDCKIPYLLEKQMSLYRELWSRIGGRPWTFIRRDLYHLAPLANIVVFVSAGFLAGVYFPVIFYWVASSGWNLVIVFTGAWLIGVLHGHFYWGKDWIEGQKKP